MLKCPRCGSKGEPSGKEWDYACFHVKLINCASCDRTFKEYYREGKLSHTIPKAKK